jgi:O-antigen/teichoic acid export membrane protein
LDVQALIFAGCSGFLASSVLKVPVELRQQTRFALYGVAVAIPLVTLTAGLRGILEARQRFGWLGLLRTATGVLTFAGPLVAAKLGGGLPAVVFCVAAIRLIWLIAQAALCLALAPDLFADRRIRLGAVVPLFHFGGWLTVSGLISPLMVSMDRFLVGIFLSMTNVAYYATPFEVVTKIKVIPSAITAVMFPALSTSLANDRASTRRIFRAGLAATVGILTPLTIFTVLVVPPRNPDALAEACRELVGRGSEGRRALGLAARERIARQFSIGAIVQRYEEFYSQTLKQRRKEGYRNYAA